MAESVYEGYMNEKNIFILWDDNSTDVDCQPASTIKGGKKFIERLEECLQQHLNTGVISLQVEPMTKIWCSFEVVAKVEGYEEEEPKEVRYALLKAAEY